MPDRAKLKLLSATALINGRSARAPKTSLPNDSGFVFWTSCLIEQYGIGSHKQSQMFIEIEKVNINFYVQ